MAGSLAMFSLALLSQVNMMEQHKRHTVLMLDEIQLTPGLAYVGRPFPWLTGENDLVTHALVFMFNGVTTRWTQTVACEFTGNSFGASAVKKAVPPVLTECEKIGLVVDFIASDMGVAIRAYERSLVLLLAAALNMPSHFPILVIKAESFTSWHLRNHFTSGQIILFPNDIVKKHRFHLRK